MADRDAETAPRGADPPPPLSWHPQPPPPPARHPIVGILFTIAAAALAIWLGRGVWQAYMEAPWTRDGTVRAYIVTMAPEVSGRIIALPVADNQYVKAGAPLLVVDPTDYEIAVRLNEAAVTQAQAAMENAEREAVRRQDLPEIAVSTEQQQTYETQAVAARARYQEALANLAQARTNLERTVIHSQVNGWVTNLLTQRGDYANAGRDVISIVDADSFWVDGYFEETALGAIRPGDPARVKLMAYPHVLRGHVDSVTRAINVANAQPNMLGVATVNPIFTWVRLAQRIPVRVHIDEIPKDLVLTAGMTATVEIDPAPAGDAGN